MLCSNVLRLRFFLYFLVPVIISIDNAFKILFKDSFLVCCLKDPEFGMDLLYLYFAISFCTEA